MCRSTSSSVGSNRRNRRRGATLDARRLPWTATRGEVRPVRGPGPTPTLGAVAGDLTDDELAFLAGVFDLARDGRHEELSGLVDQGVPVNLTNGSGDTLLILAAYHDHPATVRVLLERGADSRRVNDRGQTALGAAVFRRSVPSVQLLLASGADPDAGGRSARQISGLFHLPEMGALLRPGPAN